MRIRNRVLLRTIFSAKGNFSAGEVPTQIGNGDVQIAPFLNDAPAATCISADFELNWAWRHLDDERRDVRGARGRRNVPIILRMLSDYRVPITWATVGHLFLDSCSRGSDGRAHGSMPRPPRNFGWAGDWYVADPCSSLAEDPLWYAPDLIEKIIDSPVGHEVATHSFSHIDFSGSCSTPKLVECEIAEAFKAMQRFGLTPRSLVYPFNKMGHEHLPLLSRVGITAVRHRDVRVRLCYPQRTESGVYKIYESMNLRDPRRYDYGVKASVFLDQAIRRYGVFHLWFHPSDARQVFDNQLRSILEELSVRRESGMIWIATMADIAAYCEARRRTQVNSEWREERLEVHLKSDFDARRYGATELTLVVSTADSPSEILVASADGKERAAVNFGFDTSRRRTLVNVSATARCIRLRF